MRLNYIALILAILLFVTAAAGAQRKRNRIVPVTDEHLLQGHRGDPSTWPMYGGSYSQIRFSDLDQINRENVASLKPAWTFHTGIYNVASGYQTTPVVFNGEMYITTPRVGRDQWIMKLDARTGKEIWRKALTQGATRFCCGANNRGATLYKDKVLIATLDARLIALDPRNGDVIWETQTGNGASGYSQTCAPVVYDNKIILGVAGGEYGQFSIAMRGERPGGERHGGMHGGHERHRRVALAKSFSIAQIGAVNFGMSSEWPHSAAVSPVSM